MTEKIKEQILAVRATGQTNMFDTNMVQVIANKMKFYELVIFIEEHKGDTTSHLRPEAHVEGRGWGLLGPWYSS